MTLYSCQRGSQTMKQSWLNSSVQMKIIIINRSVFNIYISLIFIFLTAAMQFCSFSERRLEIAKILILIWPLESTNRCLSASIGQCLLRAPIYGVIKAKNRRSGEKVCLKSVQTGVMAITIRVHQDNDGEKDSWKTPLLGALHAKSPKPDKKALPVSRFLKNPKLNTL